MRPAARARLARTRARRRAARYTIRMETKKHLPTTFSAAAAALLLSVLAAACAGSAATAASGTLPDAPPRLASEGKKEAARPAEELEGLADAGAPAPAAAPAPLMERSESAKAFGGVAAGGSGRGTAAPSESGLKAGFADDNAQYNYFLDFLAKHAQEGYFRAVPVQGRVAVRVLDSSGSIVPNARIVLRDAAGRVVDEALTYSDGEAAFAFGPAPAAGKLRMEVFGPTGPRKIAPPRASSDIDPAGPRLVEARLPAARWIPAPVPLDVVFVLDTTGSMGEEIERLKATIDIIKDNLDQATPRPKLRFGLVLYKDKGDSYVVKASPLTANLAAFRSALAEADAEGGGDEPEDLEAALAAAVDSSMDWDPYGARLVFAITDAPAQRYDDAVGYDESAAKARAAGIKIHAVGTGGLPLEGEYQLRQIAQRTRGRYIFLTYGERGESEGGEPGAVSHHTGSNWTADRLETVIIRFAKEELANFGGTAPRVPADDWFKADAVPDRDPDAILDELFAEALDRLLDYSAAEIPAAAPAVVLPVAAPAAMAKDAERFGARILQAAVAGGRVKVLDRDNLQAVLGEIELGLSALSDPAAAGKLGELAGARLLVAPNLVALDEGRDGAAWEIYFRLVAVPSGEILSSSRARIAKGLGLR